MRAALFATPVFFILAGLTLPARSAEPPAPPPEAEAAKPEFETGKLIEMVVTRHDAKQSYALYLPKAYTPDRKWPILYGLSPAARGSDPVRLFMAAAEKYGWIVAGSNNSQNGPFEPVEAAINALLQDTAARLAIDERRRYATGFSGGARISFYLGLEKGFAGVIPCGGGLPGGMKKLEKGNSLAVCTIAGTKDFNYQELLRLEETLKGLGMRQRLLVFDGEHRWPPREQADSAVRYMEILWRLQAGQAAGDAPLAELLRAEAAAAAKQAELKGEYLRGHGHLAELAALARGSAVEKELADKLAAWEAAERFKKEQEAAEALRKLLAEHAGAEKSDEAFAAALGAMAKFTADHPDTDAGLRSASSVAGQGFRLAVGGSQLHQARRYAEAAAWLKRARMVYPKDAGVAYNLACAQAQAGQKDAALATLKEAVALGFKDAAHMKEDADLASLRDSDPYKAIIESLEAKPAEKDPAEKEFR